MLSSKKVLAVALTGVMSVSLLAGCGSDSSNGTEGGSDSSKAEHHKIAVGYYTDNGAALDALNAYLDGIADSVDCEFDVFTLSTYDENANLTAVQEEISAGYEGILLSADMGTQSILEECEKAGVYVGGWLCAYNESYNTNYDVVFGSDYFLGTVNDGDLDKTAYATEIANAIVDAGYKKVGLITFPSWAYPAQAEICAVAEEIFDKAGVEYVEPIELSFTTLGEGAPTYLDDNKDIDCIFSVCAGTNFVYPDLVDAGRTDIALYTAGFDATADLENFGSKGTGVFKSICVCPTESVAYPLALMIDKLNDCAYDDAPEEAERVSCSSYVITSDDEMSQLEETIYCTADYADTCLDADAFKQLCKTWNDDATYANLVDTIANLHGDL